MSRFDTMPRYYFHLRGERERLSDEEGLMLPDSEAAWYQAVRSAREVIRADLQLGCQYENHVMVIADERGAPLDHIPLRDIAGYAL